MTGIYEAIFGTNPKQIYQIYRLPLEWRDHSERDKTELLDANYMQTYQSLVGSMQWAMPLEPDKFLVSKDKDSDHYQKYWTMRMSQR
jgi:hypothetical protein